MPEVNTSGRRFRRPVTIPHCLANTSIMPSARRRLARRKRPHYSSPSDCQRLLPTDGTTHSTASAPPLAARRASAGGPLAACETDPGFRL